MTCPTPPNAASRTRSAARIVRRAEKSTTDPVSAERHLRRASPSSRQSRNTPQSDHQRAFGNKSFFQPRLGRKLCVSEPVSCRMDPLYNLTPMQCERVRRDHVPCHVPRFNCSNVRHFPFPSCHIALKKMGPALPPARLAERGRWKFADVDLHRDKNVSGRQASTTWPSLIRQTTYRQGPWRFWSMSVMR